jgi:two-component sensor histidine kinase
MARRKEFSIPSRPAKSASVKQAGLRQHGEMMGKSEDQPAERLRRQQDVLAEFGLNAFRTRDLDQLLNRASELVAEALDVRRAKILELLPNGKELLVRAGVNWNPGVVGHVRFGADGYSPAGYALSHQEPVVSPDLETETRFNIPPVLVEHGIKSMVNVIIAGKERPFGVLEVDASRKRTFDSHDVSFLRNYANLLAAAVERHRSHQELAEATRLQSVLIQDLEHRVKNMLNLVQSIANQTNAEEPEAQLFRDTFLGRLRALAQAETMVFEGHAQEIEMKRLVWRSIEPFEATHAGALFAEGPSLRLPARSGRIMALILHELGTNATKHGALSVPEGRVRISWEMEELDDASQVRFRWREEGGPKVEPPERQGFGTRLLTNLASYELDGQAQLEHPAEGLQYEIAFSVGGG